jgi:hypothetical protein
MLNHVIVLIGAISHVESIIWMAGYFQQKRSIGIEFNAI